VKRKRAPVPDTASEPLVVPEALLDRIESELGADRLKKVSKCVVCQEECAPNSVEGLCWVCRRLKLSAWRDSDTQMPAQE
jgi:hypothetical protein